MDPILYLFIFVLSLLSKSYCFECVKWWWLHYVLFLSLVCGYLPLQLHVSQAGINVNSPWVFVDGFGDMGCLHLSTEVPGVWFCRHSLFCLEPPLNLHSHPMELTGTLVDDAEASGVGGHPGEWCGMTTVIGVANSILELVDLGDFGFKLLLKLI